MRAAVDGSQPWLALWAWRNMYLSLKENGHYDLNPVQIAEARGDTGQP